MRLSTTGPCGTSIATGMSGADPPHLAAIQSAISASPAPLWRKTRSARFDPSPSTTQTWCASDAQSHAGEPGFKSCHAPSHVKVSLDSRGCAAMPANPCTGARWRDSPLGIHRGSGPGHKSPKGARWHLGQRGYSRPGRPLLLERLFDLLQSVQEWYRVRGGGAPRQPLRQTHGVWPRRVGLALPP